MSNLYLVTYKLKNGAAPAIEDELKKSPYWWHDIDNTWIIETDEPNASAVYERLAKVHPFVPDERILIIAVSPTASRQGWLPKTAWDWLKARKGASIT